MKLCQWPPSRHPALLGCLLVAVVVMWLPKKPLSAADRPNFLWIMSEDNSKHYLRPFDSSGAPTPHIRQMAEDGILFERAFSNSPVCSVARTTLITACYGPRIGTQFHRKSKLAQLPDDVQMFPAYLRQAGYYTTNNSKEDYNAAKGSTVWDESSRRASWTKRPSDSTPFFHVQTFTTSHESSLHFDEQTMRSESTQASPDEVQLAPYHPDTPTFRYTYARYHDRIGAIDKAVGDMLQQLEQQGLLEETFVFYFGDHGGVLPRGKGYAYESGLHVPLVVRVPEKWKDRVALPRGSRTEGFVEFVDFGPTVLHLAGVDVPASVDGRPFLGPDVSAEELASRKEAFGYADRFDEKYDLVRTLRVGKFKYMRNYEAFNPDGMQNNYRYRMLAYQEWRRLFSEGKLDAVQSQFFRPKSVEALYDLESDPHETRNLADDSQYAETLEALRHRLRQRLKAMPDLSFFTETHLVEQALDSPVAYGQRHRQRVAKLVDTVDFSLLPFEVARPKLSAALQSDDYLQRHWALVACACFGQQAAPLAETAEPLLHDESRLVRARAAQFLALATGQDPRPTVYAALSTTDSPVEALEILNIGIFFHDHPERPYPLDVDQIDFAFEVNERGEVQRRLDYLRGL